MATEIVCKILNRAGAEVHVLKTPDRPGLEGHGWTCTGCGKGDDPAAAATLPLGIARWSAEGHADKCRFLPA